MTAVNNKLIIKTTTNKLIFLNRRPTFYFGLPDEVYHKEQGSGHNIEGKLRSNLQGGLVVYKLSQVQSQRPLFKRRDRPVCHWDVLGTVQGILLRFENQPDEV